MGRPRLPFDPVKIMLRVERDHVDYLRARFGNGSDRDTTVTDVMRMLLATYVDQCRRRDGMPQHDPKSMALPGLDT